MVWCQVIRQTKRVGSRLTPKRRVILFRPCFLLVSFLVISHMPSERDVWESGSCRSNLKMEECMEEILANHQLLRCLIPDKFCVDISHFTEQQRMSVITLPQRKRL